MTARTDKTDPAPRLMADSGWFVNSVRAWLGELETRSRQIKARQKTLEATGHPCARDCAALLEINEAMIRTLDAEYVRLSTEPR